MGTRLTFIHTYIYIYIYIYTHTRVYVFTFIYIYVCVCVCVYICFPDGSASKESAAIQETQEMQAQFLGWEDSWGTAW